MRKFDGYKAEAGDSRELERDELRREILDRGTELLRADRSKKGYICPICSSGSGKSGTGITTDDGGKHFTCWAGCFTHADIFEIKGNEYGISDFNEQMKKCAELLNIDTGDLFEYKSAYKNSPKAEPQSKVAAESKAEPKENPQAELDLEEDYTDFFLQAHKNIDKTDYHRGLSKEVLDRFNIGYVADWKLPLKAYLKAGDGRTEEKWKAIQTSPRLIIPTGKGSYLARYTGDGKYIVKYNGAEVDYTKAKTGKLKIYNLDCIKTAKTPIYVVEGEIDALSIIDCGGEAVGLGSVVMVNRFLKYLEENKPSHTLVICLDNDDAGQKNVAKLKEGLDSLGIKYEDGVSVFEGYKDANDMLMQNRTGLKKNISDMNNVLMAIAEAEKEAERESLLDEMKKESLLSEMDGFFEYISKGDKDRVIPSGFKDIDRIMQGGFVAGLYVIGAISSLGKTTFLLQVADNIAKQGRDVLFFSLEMSRYEMMAKSLSRLSYQKSLSIRGDKRYGKTALSLLKGTDYNGYSKEEKEVLAAAKMDYKKYAGNMYIVEGMGDVTVDTVRERAERHKQITGRYPIIIIDYIQILATEEIRLSDKQAVDKNILELKRMSRDFDIPIIGISSFNRASYTDPVNLSSFKESGAVEYGSDTLIALQYDGMDFEENEKSNKREQRVRKLIKEQEELGKKGEAQKIQVKFLKQRKAPKDNTILRFYPIFCCFEDRNEYEEVDEGNPF